MRGWLIGIVLSALLVGSPAVVWAKAAPAPEEQTGQQKKEEHAKDDLFGRALDLGIYTVVVFLGLLFILTRYAWKPILQGLEERERTISAAVEESKKAREEAARLTRELEEIRQKGYAEVRQMLDEARATADRLKTERVAEAENVIQEERQRVRREISTAKDQALQEIWQQATQLAAVVATKAVRRELTMDDHHALVEEALNELQQAARERQQVLSSVES